MILKIITRFISERGKQFMKFYNLKKKEDYGMLGGEGEELDSPLLSKLVFLCLKVKLGL
jgi:hypothetical protein